MKADWWEFWVPGVGFDRARWFAQYKRERQERIANGEQLEPASRTRQMIEWILEHKPTCRILETNVFPTASRSIAELPTEQRVSACIELIFEALTPKAIVAHGRDAQEYLEINFGAKARVEYQDIEVHNQPVRCLFTKHLLYRSRQRARLIAEGQCRARPGGSSPGGEMKPGNDSAVAELRLSRGCVSHCVSQ
jgi:hypothetical protein